MVANFRLYEIRTSLCCMVVPIESRLDYFTFNGILHTLIGEIYPCFYNILVQGQLMQMTMMATPNINKELHYLNKEDRLLRWLLVKHRDTNYGLEYAIRDDESSKYNRNFQSETEDDEDDDDDEYDDDIEDEGESNVNQEKQEEQ